MRTKTIIVWCLLLSAFSQVLAQTTVTSFDELLNLSSAKYLTLKSGDIKLSQAKKAKLAAIYGIIDPTGNLSGNYTNNTKLPVNLFPAEILGGQPGTYKEVKLGVQYVTNFNAYADLKLINLQGWENLRLSKINLQTTELDNKISLKNLQENMAIVYFNIVTLQEQLKATRSNLLSADTLYQNALKKFQQGQIKQQDVNDSKVNRLNTEETIQQINYQISQQYSALKILCDMPENEILTINQVVSTELQTELPTIESNNLLLNNALNKEKYAQSNLRQLRFSNLPTLSVFGSLAAQQYNTKSTIFDNTVNWIPSNYVGIKMSIPIPDSRTISQTSRAKYDYLLAQNNAEQARIKSEIDSKQLQLDFEKAMTNYKSHEEIFSLRKDSYQKNLLNYNQGITSLDQTLNSFNAMVNSNYQLISSAINILLSESKININNKIK